MRAVCSNCKLILLLTASAYRSTGTLLHLKIEREEFYPGPGIEPASPACSEE